MSKTHRRINHLLAKLTAFRTMDALKESMTGGYVPTIYPATVQHGELARLLKSQGLTVWTGIW